MHVPGERICSWAYPSRECSIPSSAEIDHRGYVLGRETTSWARTKDRTSLEIVVEWDFFFFSGCIDVHHDCYAATGHHAAEVARQ